MNELFIAYTAGYIDAEGTIRIQQVHKGPTWNVQISFRQTNLAALIPIQNAFGGSVGEIKPYPGRRQAALTISGKEALYLCQLVLPYLIVKHSQFFAVKSAFDTYGTRIPSKVAEELLVFLEAEKEKEMDFTIFPWTTDGYEMRKGTSGNPEEFHHKQEIDAKEKSFWAGFFDGDSHLDVSRTYVCIVTDQVDGRPLLRLREIYGGTIRPGKKSIGKVRLSAVHKIKSREAVFQFLNDICPFTIEKRPQVERVLKEWTYKMEEQKFLELVKFLKAERHKEIPKGTVNKLKKQEVFKNKHMGITPAGSRRFRIRITGKNPKTGKTKELERYIKADNYEEAENARENLKQELYLIIERAAK